MDNKLVSVVMPIYNAEKYLKDNLPLLINQTYKNFELILVNDGSKDKSLAICQDFAKKDSRIKVISQENKGVSSARNLGIENSKGEYICFVDADDFTMPNYLSTLVSTIENNDLGIVNFIEIKEKNLNKVNNKIKRGGEFKDVKISKNEFFKLMFSYPNIGGGALWNKIFKKKLIGDMRFNTNYKYYEDIIFLFKYAMKCESFNYNSAVVYVYNRNNASQTNTKNINLNKLTCLSVMEEITALAKTINEEVASYAMAWQFLVNIEMRYLIHINKYKDEDVKSKVNKTLKETYQSFKRNKKNFRSFRKFGGLAYKLMQMLNY